MTQPVYGLNVSEFKSLVVRPVCVNLGLGNVESAINLVTGTGMVESSLSCLVQTGGGPALGLFQMEPDTHDDIWKTFLCFHPDIAGKIDKMLSQRNLSNVPDCTELVWNTYYAAAMCRMKYWRSSTPLGSTATDLAHYWKGVYNSSLGAGTVDSSHIAAFQTAIDA